MKNLPYLAFTAFLAIYGYFKYQAVPSQMGQSTYIITTIILVTLTAVLPYIIGLWATAKFRAGHPYLRAAVVPFLLSALGLALYFYLFIQPAAPNMSVTKILPRSVIPGLCLSTLVVFWAFWRNKYQDTAN